MFEDYVMMEWVLTMFWGTNFTKRYDGLVCFNIMLLVIDVVVPQWNKFIEVNDYRSIGFVMCSLHNWKNPSPECFFICSTEQVSVNVIFGSTITLSKLNFELFKWNINLALLVVFLSYYINLLWILMWKMLLVNIFCCRVPVANSDIWITTLEFFFNICLMKWFLWTYFNAACGRFYKLQQVPQFFIVNKAGVNVLQVENTESQLENADFFVHFLLLYENGKRNHLTLGPQLLPSLFQFIAHSVNHYCSDEVFFRYSLPRTVGMNFSCFKRFQFV
jgi:hypothetical protein